MRPLSPHIVEKWDMYVPKNGVLLNLNRLMEGRNRLAPRFDNMLSPHAATLTAVMEPMESADSDNVQMFEN